jgi:uncharacterized protein YegP (UPF0339 family)
MDLILSKSSDGQFRFVLKAGMLKTILSSELYVGKGSAETRYSPSVQTNCSEDSRLRAQDLIEWQAFFNLKAAEPTSHRYESNVFERVLA